MERSETGEVGRSECGEPSLVGYISRWIVLCCIKFSVKDSDCEIQQ